MSSLHTSTQHRKRGFSEGISVVVVLFESNNLSGVAV
jgi:hypothetical protein